MGWKEGDGLGKEKQGEKNFIQVEQKIGMSGVGFTFSNIQPQKHEHIKMEVDLDKIHLHSSISSAEKEIHVMEEWIEVSKVSFSYKYLKNPL